MKKLFAFLLIASVMAVSIPTSLATDVCSDVPHSTADFYVETTRASWLMSQSCVDSQVVTTMPQGSVMHVIGKTEGWHKLVTEDGRQGWMWEDFVTPTTKPFNPVQPEPDDYVPMRDIAGHQYEQAIWHVYNNNIVQGYPDGSYQPDRIINRAELLKIIVESAYNLEYQAYTNTNCFPDVPPTEWYAKYVCFAQSVDLVEGYPDGTFRPADEINFVEALKIGMIGLGYGYIEGDPWYVNILDDATLNNRNFVPHDVKAVDSAFTRAQMAEMITRMMKYNESPSALVDFISELFVDLKDPLFAGTKNHEFYNALRDEDIDTVTALINDGMDVNLFFDDWRGDSTMFEGDNILFKNTPLHIAASLNNLELAELLIDNGAELETISSAGFHGHSTALFDAAHFGHLEMVQFLLDEGANIDADGTPLFVAAQEGHLDVVELLITEGADVNKTGAYSGLTPLDIAANGDIENALINAGGVSAEEL